MGLLQPVTAVELPLQALQQALQLSEEQARQIAQIQRAFQQARQELMPPPPGPGNPPPSQEQMKAIQEKVRALEQEANQRIGALLTPEQRERLGRLIRDTNDFRIVGIPPMLAPRLQLTVEQRQAIGGIAERTRQALRAILEQGPQGDPQAFRQRIEQIRADAHKAAMGVLTEAQRGAVQQFIRQNPGPGGPPRPPQQ